MMRPVWISQVIYGNRCFRVATVEDVPNRPGRGPMTTTVFEEVSDNRAQDKTLSTFSPGGIDAHIKACFDLLDYGSLSG